MFKDLHKITVDLLAEKVDNFIFKDKETGADENLTKIKNSIFDVDSFLKVSKLAYKQEETVNKIDEDKRVDALKKCTQRWKVLEEQQAVCAAVSLLKRSF